MTEKKGVDPVGSVNKALPTEEEIYELSELYKVFGDSTRTKILSCLGTGDFNVGQIASMLEMSVSAVSHQLRVLRNARLVKGIKAGKEVKYSLDDSHVAEILECGLEHIRHTGKR